jgi:O-antigen/teichoic acid export membrane protein
MLKEFINKILGICKNGYLLTSLLLYLSRFIIEFFVIAHFGKENYALWASLVLYTIIFSNSHLGIANAFSINYPFYMGKRRSEVMSGLVGMYKVSFLLSLLINLVIGNLLLFFQTTIKAFDLLAVSVYISGITLYTYDFIYYRSRLNFKMLIWKQTILSVSIGTIFFFLQYFHSLSQFILVYGIIFCLLNAFFLIRTNHVLINFNEPIRKLKIYFRNNLQQGFPIMLVGVMYSLLMSLDRFFVKSVYSKAEFGSYSFSCNFFLSGTMFLSILISQYYPNMAFEIGKSGLNEQSKSYFQAEKSKILFFSIFMIVPLLLVIAGLYYFPITKNVVNLQILIISVILSLAIPFYSMALMDNSLLAILKHQNLQVGILVISMLIDGVIRVVFSVLKVPFYLHAVQTLLTAILYFCLTRKAFQKKINFR